MRLQLDERDEYRELFRARIRHLVEVRDALEQLRPAALRHAAHEAEHDVRLLAAVGAHAAHLAERLLLGLVAHRTGVDEDGVGVRFVGGDRVAAIAEHLCDLFRVALVHLATVGADKNLGHGGWGGGR